MSPREKKLLTFFAVGGFLVINLLGFNFFSRLRIDIRGKHSKAVTELKQADMIRASREEVESQMDWLDKHEPQPSEYQPVQTALQELAAKEVTAVGLTLKDKGQKFLPTDQSHPYFHRAKVQFTVIGPERSLYTWFDHLNTPDSLRCVTYIRLSPNKEDDTLIECIAIVEQWFVPVPSA